MALHILLLNFFFFFAPVKTDAIPKSIYDFKVTALDGSTTTVYIKSTESFDPACLLGY